MPYDLEPCSLCNDKGTVPVREHARSCTPLKCSGECPRIVQRQCPACAKRELGDDLQWSGAG